MEKYILSKTKKGKKFEYVVTDEAGNIVSKRTSARDYVACTANGEYYFGRLDLIGKGEHGRRLSAANAFFSNPKQTYKDMINYFIPSVRAQMRAERPYDKFVESHTPQYENTIRELNKIAYLAK